MFGDESCYLKLLCLAHASHERLHLRHAQLCLFLSLNPTRTLIHNLGARCVALYAPQSVPGKMMSHDSVAVGAGELRGHVRSAGNGAVCSRTRGRELQPGKDEGHYLCPFGRNSGTGDGPMRPSTSMMVHRCVW